MHVLQGKDTTTTTNDGLKNGSSRLDFPRLKSSFGVGWRNKGQRQCEAVSEEPALALACLFALSSFSSVHPRAPPSLCGLTQTFPCRARSFGRGALPWGSLRPLITTSLRRGRQLQRPELLSISRQYRLCVRHSVQPFSISSRFCQCSSPCPLRLTVNFLKRLPREPMKPLVLVTPAAQGSARKPLGTEHEEKQQLQHGIRASRGRDEAAEVCGVR